VTSTNALNAPALATPDLKPVKESRSNLPLILGAIVVLILLALLVGGALAGPRLLAALQAGPTPTPVVITVLPGQTLPPDLSPELIKGLTQQAATNVAINGTNEANQTAIAQLQATDTPVPTANLTATFQACTFASTITTQDPADGTNLPINHLTTVKVQLQNSGNCAWEDGTTFAFDSGDDPRAANQTDPIKVPATAPNSNTTIELPLQPTTAQTYVSKWVLKLPNGQTIGQPLTLTYKVPAAATSVPQATTGTGGQATATPGGPTATAFVEKNLNGVSLRVNRCNYSGSNYTCSVSVNIDGGVPVWNVSIVGANGGQFTWDVGDARVWQMVAPRCDAEDITVTVIDSNDDQVSSTLSFDPTTSAAFAGGGCTP
jgi:hypothetical protein